MILIVVEKRFKEFPIFLFNSGY